MMLLKRSCIVATTLLMGMAFTHQAVAAIALDRTRVIFNGAEKSISLNVSNQNKDLPYLAQGWMENENGERIESPLIVLPRSNVLNRVIKVRLRCNHYLI